MDDPIYAVPYDIVLFIESWLRFDCMFFIIS